MTCSVQRRTAEIYSCTTALTSRSRSTSQAMLRSPAPCIFLPLENAPSSGFAVRGSPSRSTFLLMRRSTSARGLSGSSPTSTFFSENYGLGENRVQLHCDNCSGQNKNNFVLWYFAWRVMKGLHSEVNINFLPAGHTKFAPDWCFGLMKRAFRRSEVSCLDDLCEVVEESTARSKINIPQLVWERGWLCHCKHL